VPVRPGTLKKMRAQVLFGGRGFSLPDQISGPAAANSSQRFLPGLQLIRQTAAASLFRLSSAGVVFFRCACLWRKGRGSASFIARDSVLHARTRVRGERSWSKDDELKITGFSGRVRFMA
jgi:hypothetical protein